MCFLKKLTDLFQLYPTERRKRMKILLLLRKQIGRGGENTTRIRGASATKPEKKERNFLTLGPQTVSPVKIDEDDHYCMALGDEEGSLL